MFDFDPHRNCLDLFRFADDGGSMPDVCDAHQLQEEPLIVDTIDPHSHDFHVYIDGSVRYRVPCGVCEGPQAPEFAAMRTRYDTPLHDTIRETVRAHMEALVRQSHPDSSVAVR